MDNKLLMEALDALEEEKQISKEKILEALEAALLSAYKKEYYKNTGKNKDKDKDKEKEKEAGKDFSNVKISIDRDTGDISIIAMMTVVEEVEDDKSEISLAYAQQIDPRLELGDTIPFYIPNDNFKRVAAHAAKNVLKQKIRENERSMIYADFVGRQGEIVTGIVQRKSNRTIFVDIGRTEGILPAKEQVPGENFNVHDRIKALIMDVKKASDDSKTNKRNDSGSQVFLSRSHPNFVRKLFEMEVPEIQDGTVEIRGIAREAGSRTKIAVYTEFENVDPIGSCVGTRGARVQAVVDELSGEKIDIIAWSEDPEELIASVLSPAEVEEVIIDSEEEKKATAIVPDRQLSLAIGKEGQNVRLAARVSGWGIDIKSHSQYFGDEIVDYGYDYGDAPKEVENMEETGEPSEVDEGIVEVVEDTPDTAENTADAEEQDAE